MTMSSLSQSQSLQNPDVIRGDAEVEATEPETVWASAAEMPDVATAEAVGVAGAVVEVSVVLDWRGMGIPHWSRAVGRDVGGAAADCAAMLTEDYEGKQKTHYDESH